MTDSMKLSPLAIALLGIVSSAIGASIEYNRQRQHRLRSRDGLEPWRKRPDVDDELLTVLV